MRVQLAAAYLLHRRPYRDSSELLETFSLDHGRVPLVARGVSRRRRGGSLAAVLQPFRPLLLSFSGKGELMSLGAAEVASELPPLQGEALFSGFYLNELLLRVLQRFEPNPPLFAAYASALSDLSQARPIEPTLRRFEFILLEVLGYAIDLEYEAQTGDRLDPDAHYRLDTQRGFLRCARTDLGNTQSFAGGDLRALARGDFGECAVAAKRLVRALLQPHLGDAPLKSRKMFAASLTQSQEAAPSR